MANLDLKESILLIEYQNALVFQLALKVLAWKPIESLQDNCKRISV